MELLALLCALGVCSSLALGNDVKAFAPEDLDGSGDDEDYSGSGIEDFLEYDTKDVNVFSTSVTLLVHTITQMSTALQPDVPVDEESEIEHTTKHMEDKKIDKEDIFAVQEPSVEGTTLKATTQQPFVVGTTLKPTTQQSFTVESDGERKHHHHHHHHPHPHHHTTTPVTTSEDRFAVDPVVEEPSAENATTIKPTPQQQSTVESVDNLEKKHHHHHHIHHHTTTPAEFDLDAGTEVEQPFVATEEPTTTVPDEDFEVNEVAQNVTLMPEDSVQETASGSSSTPYADETTTLQADIDDFPIFVHSEKETTVAVETSTEQGHHHHPHHTTTVTPLNGSGIIEETENYELKPETDHDPHERTTKMSPEDRHDHHHHHHNHPAHHHTTTASATPSTAPEKDLVVPTHEPKGRRINVPLAESTAAVPVKEDEQMPESLEPVDSSEGPSGDVEDFFIENTVPVVQQDKIDPVPEDGSSDASHGILDRKELLAGIIAGGVAGLVFAAALVAFVFYRMKKKDEGSYSLEEPKQSNGGYQKPREQREFYA